MQRKLKNTKTLKSLALFLLLLILSQSSFQTQEEEQESMRTRSRSRSRTRRPSTPRSRRPSTPRTRTRRPSTPRSRTSTTTTRGRTRGTSTSTSRSRSRRRWPRIRSGPRKPKGCLTTEGSVCKVCENGYYLTGTFCQSCDKGCGTCDSKGCLTCKSGYFSHGKISPTSKYVRCNACLSGCSLCQNGTVCMECSSLRVKADEGKKCTINYVLLGLFSALVASICLVCWCVLWIAVWWYHKNTKSALKSDAKALGSVHPIRRPSAGFTSLPDRSFQGQNPRQQDISNIKEIQVPGHQRNQWRQRPRETPVPIASPQRVFVSSRNQKFSKKASLSDNSVISGFNPADC